MVILCLFCAEILFLSALWPTLLAFLINPMPSRQLNNETSYDNNNIIMLPNINQQIFEVNSNVSVTCIYSFHIRENMSLSSSLTWRLPDYLSKYPELSKATERVQITWGNNDTHIFSTMTLSEAVPRDTGYYECYLALFPQMQAQQYIYIFSESELVVIDDIGSHWYNFQLGECFVPCKPTHPDVIVSLRRTFTFSFQRFVREENPIDLLSLPNSNWILEPKFGLTLKKFALEDSGLYECVGTFNNTSNWKDFGVVVSGVELARVDDSDEVKEGDNTTLICRAYMFSGPPEWTYLNTDTGTMQVIDETNPPEGIAIVTQQFNAQNDNLPMYQSRLDYVNIRADNITQFQCKAADSEEGAEIVSEFVTLKVKKVHRKSAVHGIVAATVATGTLIAGIVIGIKLSFVYKKRQAAQQAKTFLKRKCLEINVHIPIDEQTDALPYNKEWEFPRHRLKLGIQLGTGCFGRVVKAEATGIRGACKASNKSVKTVAVKMALSQNDVLALEALVSELKILMYLGSHLNVLNLLGACTKQISKGELLIIVEYCRFGNLQAYLFNHRKYFVNQLDEMGNLQIDGETTDPAIQLVSQQSINPIQHEEPNVRHQSNSLRYENITEFVKSSYNSQELKSLWNYQQDPENVILSQTFSTRDLICWSFQIARGMDYVASRKVVHGDLAARNILLADDGVVKIADFGMARKMYYDCNYQKKGQGLLPVKWMAIESLTDRTFSTLSDVWSYGILLWELFSLGKVPYPGIEAGHQLITELQTGYRMEKASFTPNFIGKIMDSCWKMEPKDRPTFSQLENMISGHLETCVSSHYLELNVPYANLNEQKEQERKNEAATKSLLVDSPATPTNIVASPEEVIFVK